MKIIVPSLSQIFLFYFLSIFIIFSWDIKSYLIGLALITIIIYKRTKFSLIECLFLLLIFSLPFETGIRDFFFPVFQKITTFKTVGYSIYFGFSIKYFLAIILSLYTIIKIPRASAFVTRNHVVIFIFITLLSISTFLSARADISFAGLTRISLSVLIFFLTTFFVKNNPKILVFIITILIAHLLQQSSVAVLQIIHQSPIGLPLLENTAHNPNYTTDGEGRNFRAAGTLGHATFFGSLMVFLLPYFLYFVKYILVDKKTMILMKWMLVGLITIPMIGIYGSMSRSAIILFIFVLSLWIVREKFARFKNILIIIGIIFSSAVIIIQPIRLRAISLIQVYTTGSGVMRQHLNNIGLGIINDNPIWGIGLNRFVEVMTHDNNLNSIQDQLYPIHNSLLLVTVEAGIPTASALILFIISIMMNKSNRKFKTLVFASKLAIFSLLVSSLVHPLFFQDPSLDYLMLSSGIISVLSNHETNLS